MKPLYFSDRHLLRKWFEENSQQEKELLVGFHKVSSGKASITWSESVDEALCFGWIDGVRKSIDETAYTIRFTPRKPSSIWSAVNIRKIDELTKAGRMTAAGIAAFGKRKEKTSKVYSFEQPEVTFDKALLKTFRSNKPAWKYFNKQAPSYIKAATWWVINAKREETKLKRLDELIKSSAAEEYIRHLRRPGK